MYNIKPIESREEWQRFVDTHSSPSFMQSWEWGECQAHLGHIMFPVGIYESSKLVGVALIIKSKAKRGNFLSISHGPIVEKNYSEVLKELTSYLIELAKKEQCIFIRFLSLLDNTNENKNMFQKLGYKDAPLYLHSENAWVLDLEKTEDELMGDMRKTTRYLIRKAEKDGVVIEKRTDEKAIDDFMKLYAKTVERENFTGFSKTYIEEEFKTFHKQGNALFFFGKANKNDNNYIAGALILYTKSAACYHQGASIHTKVPVTYLLQWESIKEAKKRGCKLYNFWGIAPEDKPNHPWTGITMFKKGFGGRMIHFLPTQDYVIAVQYHLTALYEKVLRWRRGV
jgi:peptidoglycan pentaglycine glycine transferase (the first glycine)